MNQHDVLNQLRYEWTMLAPSATSQLTWQRICRDYELDHLCREPDFGAVLRRLEPGGGLTVEQRSHVVQVLLMEAGDIPLNATAPASSTLEARLELLRQQPQYAHLAHLTWLRVFAERPLRELALAEGVSVARLRSDLQNFAKRHLL